jgi:hypothetical protein
MLLLAGRAAGTAFGPDYFQERVKWATEGSPPNLVAIIARVAGQTIRSATHVRTIQSPPVPLTPEIVERIRVNRDAALQRRMTSSPGPLVPTQPETPPTRLVQRVPCKRQQNTQKLADAITRGLPASVFPRDRCFKCAGKHKSDSCTEPPSSCISSLLIRAQCCTKCAIPL